ncbi:MAG: polysaccharide pyruvyl transferase family protein [Bacteroidota bacterium]
MTSKLKTLLKPAYRMGKALKRDMENQYIHSRVFQKPIVVNLLANDICNSKCTMCNIWEQKLDFEITPGQLGEILKDDLFSEISHIGVTGGEPTLRKDLPQLYEAACKALPNLKGMSIITNAIRRDQVIERVEEVIEVLESHGKDFSMMVSLDGYGEMHDKHRGRPGNFETAVEVIRHFKKNHPYSVATGCTISKTNVWGVDELLDFLVEESVYGRFRIAEFITRLYNNNITDRIRAFDDDEIYHLIGFFKKLEQTFEQDPTYQHTYRNIQHMLQGGQRMMGCPYHVKGVVLDSRGQILYCAPKSKNLGSALKESALNLFKENQDEKQRILKENCQDCIHDYHYPPTYEQESLKYSEWAWNKALSFRAAKTTARLAPAFGTLDRPKDRKVIYITGWYGTETVGDKAILGAIMNHYEAECDGKVEFWISAYYPFVTERTLVELEKPGRVIPVYSADFIKAAKTADITVMGGGPLMGIEALATPLTAFRVAKQAGKKLVIFGCGMGPLKEKVHLDAATEMLKLSDEITLRDQTSVAWAKQLTGRTDISCIGDPAGQYVREIAENLSPETKPYLACFLRDWTPEYIGDLSPEEQLNLKLQFESRIAEEIKHICKVHNLIPAFYCMHTFFVGGDDRDFYRRFIKTHFEGEAHYLEHRPSSVNQIISAMKSARFNICMRFHSVLMAHTLGVDFFAIDYTNGGKIKGFLQDNDALDRMISLQDLAHSNTFHLPFEVVST